MIYEILILISLRKKYTFCELSDLWKKYVCAICEVEFEFDLPVEEPRYHQNLIGRKSGRFFH